MLEGKKEGERKMTLLTLLDDLSLWREAAVKVHNKWSNEYGKRFDRNNLDVFSVVRDHTTLPEHYWHSLHEAFVRREAAREFLEIIREVEQQIEEKGKSDIVMEHTNINV